jgi:DNA-binding SARP family transcriptional activator
LLCYLVAHRRARRDVVADALWPDLLDARHNLRVTLNYLQHVLEPDRARQEASSHLVTDADSLALQPGPRLQCDLWELERMLDIADRAERDGQPAPALDAYRAAMPLWRGAPYEDIVADWARDEQVRWLRRYLAAAVRAGDLLLAAGDHAGAAEAAGYALRADPTDERSYQLLARAHLAADDPHRARSALDQCRQALDALGVQPSPATVELMRSSGWNERGGPEHLAG